MRNRGYAMGPRMVYGSPPGPRECSSCRGSGRVADEEEGIIYCLCDKGRIMASIVIGRTLDRYRERYMSDRSYGSPAAKALHDIILQLGPLSKDDRVRVLGAVTGWFGTTDEPAPVESATHLESDGREK